MPREIVTSENREEYMEKKLAEKSMTKPETEKPEQGKKELKKFVEKLRISSPNEKDLAEKLSKYLGGSNIRFEGEDVYNAKGLIPHYKVRNKKGRYHLHELFEDKQ
jgi:hypothetical protein